MAWIESIISATTIAIAVASMLSFVIGGAWIASQRGRSKREGALLGFFFGPFGMIVEALLPSWPTRYRTGGRVTVVPEYSDTAKEDKGDLDKHDEVVDWLES